MIASMNLPVVGQVIKASPDDPYLSFKLEFTQNQILDILNDSRIQPMPKENLKASL
ncbi:AraC family transcriptional regulator N-terminal domain-containing protein [Paenibacillus terrae]